MVSYRRLAMRVLGHVPVLFGKKKAAPPPRVAAQRIAALALACAMMTGMTLPAFAATYDIVSGSIDIHATKDGNLISQWNWNDENKKEYVSDSSGYIKDRLDNEITITGTSTGNTVTIDADKDQTANVTLDNVNINVDEQYEHGYDPDQYKTAVEVTGSGNTNIELNGNNTLTSGYGHAGLEHNKTDDSGTLTIQDEKNDDGSAKGSASDTTGSLTATGGYHSAGIGSGQGDLYPDGDGMVIVPTVGNVTIEGNAKIENAKSGSGGSGIGGGAIGIGNVIIRGNAQIGNAIGGEEGAGIGGGAGGLGDVTIEGKATIQNAQGGIGAAGIGGGAESEPDVDGTGNKTGNTISIQGTEAGSPNITAKGGTAGTILSLKSGEEEAISGGAAIGSGSVTNGQKKAKAAITIKGKVIIDATAGGKLADKDAIAIGDALTGEQKFAGLPVGAVITRKDLDGKDLTLEGDKPTEQEKPEKPDPEKPNPNPNPENPNPNPENPNPNPENPNPNPEQPNPNPEQPSEPSGAVSTSASAEELTASDAEYLVTVEGLSVTNALEKQITHTCTLNAQGKVLTIRVNSIVATAHLTMETLRTLKAQGVETIRFCTLLYRPTSVSIDALLNLGVDEADILWTHNGIQARLTVGGTDSSSLLQ